MIRLLLSWVKEDLGSIRGEDWRTALIIVVVVVAFLWLMALVQRGVLL